MRVILVENEDWRLSADIGKYVMFHVVMHRWGAQKLKQYRAILNTILAKMKSEGVSCVYATPYAADKRAQKLIALFDFKRFWTGDDLVVMRRIL